MFFPVQQLPSHKAHFRCHLSQRCTRNQMFVAHDIILHCPRTAIDDGAAFIKTKCVKYFYPTVVTESLNQTSDGCTGSSFPARMILCSPVMHSRIFLQHNVTGPLRAPVALDTPRNTWIEMQKPMIPQFLSGRSPMMICVRIFLESMIFQTLCPSRQSQFFFLTAPARLESADSCPPTFVRQDVLSD